MPIKAAKPEIVKKRLKMFLYGPTGSRKTTSAIQFPQSVLIDMEKGSEQYVKSILKAGSVVLHTTSQEDIVSEIKSLLTEKHPYRTLILDPISILYESIQEKWSRLFEKWSKTEKEKEMQDFGIRYWNKVKSDYKAVKRMLSQLDMNVIVTAHEKDIYGLGMQKIGVGPDSMKGDSYFFDYVFHLSVQNGSCIATTKKQRSEPLNKPTFPEEFEWSYKNFCEFYGSEIIEKEADQVRIATSAQVDEIKRLVDIVRLDEETIGRWMTKADCDSWDEMTSDQLQKCIDFVKSKIETLKGENI